MLVPDRNGRAVQKPASSSTDKLQAERDLIDNCTMRKPRFGQAVLSAVLFLVSCGGSSGQTGAAGNGGGGRAGSGAAGGAGGQTGGTGGAGASCGSVSACGGNIVGTWRVTGSCVTGTKDLSSVCAGASADFAFTYAGTLTYNADGTYDPALTGTVTVHEHYPSGCAPFGLTCAQLGQAAVDAAAVISDSCSTDAAGACNCDSVSQATSSNAPGTYSTSGGTLTTTQGGTTSTNTYCVQGGVLHEIAGPQDGGLAGMGEVVLSKQ
jgi:hypothetical protein